MIRKDTFAAHLPWLFLCGKSLRCINMPQMNCFVICQRKKWIECWSTEGGAGGGRIAKEEMGESVGGACLGSRSEHMIKIDTIRWTGHFLGAID